MSLLGWKYDRYVKEEGFKAKLDRIYIKNCFYCVKLSLLCLQFCLRLFCHHRVFFILGFSCQWGCSYWYTLKASTQLPIMLAGRRLLLLSINMMTVVYQSPRWYLHSFHQLLRYSKYLCVNVFKFCRLLLLNSRAFASRVLVSSVATVYQRYVKSYTMYQ